MSSKHIFEAAEEYGWQDDFGRWNFKDDGLLDFVIAVARAEREACAKLCDKRAEPNSLDSGVAMDCAEAIRARGEA